MPTRGGPAGSAAVPALPPLRALERRGDTWTSGVTWLHSVSPTPFVGRVWSSHFTRSGSPVPTPLSAPILFPPPKLNLPVIGKLVMV